MISSSVGRERQRDVERGADTGLGNAADRASVRIDNTLGDVQPQARSGLLVLLAGRVVRIEDVRQVVGGDAGSAVGDIDLRVVAARAAGDVNAVAGLGEF